MAIVAGAPASLVRGDELADRLGTDERHVAAEDDDGGALVLSVQRGESRGGCAAGAVGARLHGDGDAVAQHGRERARGRVDDDDALRARGQRGAHGPQDHRHAAHLVQRLGRARAHARALAGGEYQHGGGGHPLDAKGARSRRRPARAARAAGEPGLEPGLEEPKSPGLPLPHSPIAAHPRSAGRGAAAGARRRRRPRRRDRPRRRCRARASTSARGSASRGRRSS